MELTAVLTLAEEGGSIALASVLRQAEVLAEDFVGALKWMPVLIGQAIWSRVAPEDDAETLRR